MLKIFQGYLFEIKKLFLKERKKKIKKMKMNKKFGFSEKTLKKLIGKIFQRFNFFNCPKIINFGFLGIL